MNENITPTGEKKRSGPRRKKVERPPWWPTAEQKLHADAACAHPDRCNVQPRNRSGKPEN